MSSFNCTNSSIKLEWTHSNKLLNVHFVVPCYY